MTALVKRVGERVRVYPVSQSYRVRTHQGDGRLVYMTDDRFAGVQLDGERRVDEYAFAWMEVIK